MDWKTMIYNDRFPKSNNYNPEFVAENQMGPNALWLMEWLTEKIEIKENMKVLDLGCGRAMSSIFLAKEFGAMVYATDLWIDVSENQKRIVEYGLEDRIIPIKAEAHALPFAKNFFDVIVAVDSYGYFGTDDLYLSYITSFLKPEGIMAAALPGLMQDFDNFKVPEHLLEQQGNGHVFWEPDNFTFHTKDWWFSHWMKTSLVEVETSDTLEDGYKHWAKQEKALEFAGRSIFPSDEETLLKDAGRYIGFIRIVARKSKDETEESMPHPWQPEFSAICDAIFSERDSRKEE
ncbi:MAG: methyltransferase domain-containing protein [Planctomycetes bacterium]|nr:methyltransferase domain-containing protein [Planctomycetota bacterium]